MQQGAIPVAQAVPMQIQMGQQQVPRSCNAALDLIACFDLEAIAQ